MDPFAESSRAQMPAPPEDLWDVGGGDFHEVGVDFLRHFINVGGLRASDAVIDMGCGVGRMAVPLAYYLDASGSYAGFDISREAIDWCRENVAPLHPNFEFTAADLFNKRYNPEGKTKAADFRFPYEDDSFSFAIATSLFTHLLPEDMRHYLAEAARVVRPGGTLFLTFYLLDPEIEDRKALWPPSLSFEHALDGCRVNNEEIPEAVVAFAVEDVEAACAAAGLEIQKPIHYGSWSGAEDALRWQDILLIRG
jgi:SAM-dependent methyltransferase